MGERNWDSSYNIDVAVGPHSDTSFDNHLRIWNFKNCDVNQSVRDHLTKLFRHLINFNDGRCRSLETIAKLPDGSWNEDWTEYWNMNINAQPSGDDDDNVPHLIMVYFTKINPCIIQEESWQSKLTYMITFNVNVYSVEFGNLWQLPFENLCAQVIISPVKHSLQSLAMLKVIKSLGNRQEIETVRKVWSSSFPSLVELMDRLAEFVSLPKNPQAVFLENLNLIPQPSPPPQGGGSPAHRESKLSCN